MQHATPTSSPPPVAPLPGTPWRVADLMVKAVGAALIGGAITLVGYWLDARQKEIAEENGRLRAIVEFASSQKTLDVNLGMQLLEKFVDSYLKTNDLVGDPGEADEMLVLLRLIALNFQDVPINLRPLFQDLDSRLGASANAEAGRLQQQLRAVAQEVANRQAYRVSYLGGVLSRPQTVPVGDERSFLEEGLPFAVRVLEVNPDGARIELRVEGGSRVYGPFWTSFFDSPILDNVKVDADTRISVLLDGVEGQQATVRMLSFIADLAADRFDIKEMTRELYTRRH